MAPSRLPVAVALYAMTLVAKPFCLLMDASLTPRSTPVGTNAVALFADGPTTTVDNGRGQVDVDMALTIEGQYILVDCGKV